MSRHTIEQATGEKKELKKGKVRSRKTRNRFLIIASLYNVPESDSVVTRNENEVLLSV
ncbi:hypothetical protein AMATHDRAFT_58665, partial [Amanita thiersii Skay4041]